MHILFRDGSKIKIDFVDSSLSNTLQSIYKHLQHVDIPFRSHGQDNPLYIKNSTFPSLVDNLVSFGKKVAVEVDSEVEIKVREIVKKTRSKTPSTEEKNESSTFNLGDVRAIIQKRKAEAASSKPKRKRK